MASKGRPSAAVVTLDGSWDSPSVGGSFQLTSGTDDLATQLFDLSRGLRSHLSGAAADRVVIRRADLPPTSSRKEGPRKRLLAEGALIAAAREHVERVIVKNGKELAEACPLSGKEALDAYAGRVAPGESDQAVASALVGLIS